MSNVTSDSLQLFPRHLRRGPIEALTSCSSSVCVSLDGSIAIASPELAVQPGGIVHQVDATTCRHRHARGNMNTDLLRRHDQQPRKLLDRQRCGIETPCRSAGGPTANGPSAAVAPGIFFFRQLS